MTDEEDDIDNGIIDLGRREMNNILNHIVTQPLEEYWKDWRGGGAGIKCMGITGISPFPALELEIDGTINKEASR